MKGRKCKSKEKPRRNRYEDGSIHIEDERSGAVGHILVLLGRDEAVAHSTQSVPDKNGLNGLVITAGELASCPIIFPEGVER
ncbi:hypothetical protein HNY73_005678 [Argiope bruennichi]|uniref:Uncharacterized protein n=1 Tax=Argiope bruennichi TaxID=94029 RepID=A0A8T0FJR0_ARGBR|nr:hypothetical protein HNY73_005678 [Argiope bruennichi]